MMHTQLVVGKMAWNVSLFALMCVTSPYSAAVVCCTAKTRRISTDVRIGGAVSAGTIPGSGLQQLAAAVVMGLGLS